MGTSLKIGIDVGGTFTDFIVSGDDRKTVIHKVLSTPDDPSLAVLAGLQELAPMLMPKADFRQVVAWIEPASSARRFRSTISGGPSRCSRARRSKRCRSAS